MSNTVRRLLLVAPFVLSIGVPYVMVSESMKSHRDTIRSWFQGGGNSTSSADASLASGESQAGSSASGVVQQPPVTDLSQILRFDISPRWVLDRWPQVTTTRGGPACGTARRAGDRHATPRCGRSIDLLFRQATTTATHCTARYDWRRTLSRVAGDTILSTQAGAGARRCGLYGEMERTADKCAVVRRKPVLHANEMLGRADVMLELNRATNYVRLSPELEKTLAGISGTPTASAPPAVKATANSESKLRFQTIPGGGIGTLFSGY